MSARTCEACGKSLAPEARSDRVTCSTACRRALSRRSAREARRAPRVTPTDPGNSPIPRVETAPKSTGNGTPGTDTGAPGDSRNTRGKRHVRGAYVSGFCGHTSAGHDRCGGVFGGTVCTCDCHAGGQPRRAVSTEHAFPGGAVVRIGEPVKVRGGFTIDGLPVDDAIGPVTFLGIVTTPAGTWADVRDPEGGPLRAVRPDRLLPPAVVKPRRTSCERCAGPMPAKSRSDRRTCSARCRVALARTVVAA